MGGELGGNSLGSGLGVERLSCPTSVPPPPPPHYVRHFLDSKLARLIPDDL